MATPNRSALITRTIKVLRKHFKPVTPPKDRSLFEHLLFACLVEDSPNEIAEEVLVKLKKDYFGWNEVRVSTIRELTEVCKPLVNPAEAAGRLKQTLQSVFESVYEFDIETFKKQNIGQAVKMLQKYRGTSPFVVAYTTQMALGGHSIPINRGALVSMHTVGVISDDELKKRVVPGLERTISKNKGIEIGSLLHQFGVEVGRNPTGQNARKLLLEIDPKCKDRLPKRHTFKPEPVEPPKPQPPATPAKGAAKDKAPPKTAPAKTPPAKPATKQKAIPPTKRPAAKKAAKESRRPTKKGTKKPTTRKLTRRKPR
jgi:endonuclease III